MDRGTEGPPSLCRGFPGSPGRGTPGREGVGRVSALPRVAPCFCSCSRVRVRLFTSARYLPGLSLLHYSSAFPDSYRLLESKRCSQ
jgi:hypothetical protein